MTATPTPGPWVLETRVTEALNPVSGKTEPFTGFAVTVPGRATIVDGQDSHHCSNGYAIGPEETLANARLMAASPDLLAALEGCVRVADRATAEFDAARAAIAKARGRE